MTFDFDRVVSRRNTNSLKYDFAVERGKPADLLPMWVADMDFPTVPAVAQKLAEVSLSGIYGYSDGKPSYYEAVAGWLATRFGWQPQPQWLVKTPGVVYAICTAIRAFTRPGDAVLIQEPVYYPFRSSVLVNERRLVVNELVYADGAYSMDFGLLENQIRDNGVKMLLLCSPHNPVGRVWSRDELTRLGEICRRYNVLIVADEIHADFALTRQHQVFPAVCPTLTAQTILCTAPSKTFNLAGLQISNIFIADNNLRAAFQTEMERSGYSQVGLMGLVACETAYREGEAWLDALRTYLKGNFAFLAAKLIDTPLRLVPAEGTYLAWLDCKALNLDDDQLDDFMLNHAHLWLDRGDMFGTSGSGFQRINIACPRSTLAQALEQLTTALKCL